MVNDKGQNMNDFEFHVVMTRCMDLSWQQDNPNPPAKQYLESKGFTGISFAKYWRTWGAIKNKTREHIVAIALKYKELYLDRLWEFRTIRAEMWLMYHSESDTFKKVRILEAIGRVLENIQALEEACKDLIEDGVLRQHQQEKEENVAGQLESFARGPKDRADS